MKDIMQAYKLKGKIDQFGNLLITEPVNLPPGNVEVVVWQATDTVDHNTAPISEPVPANASPFLPDFDPDQAK
jgi:hypothetical protein